MSRKCNACSQNATHGFMSKRGIIRNVYCETHALQLKKQPLFKNYILIGLSEEKKIDFLSELAHLISIVSKKYTNHIKDASWTGIFETLSKEYK